MLLARPASRADRPRRRAAPLDLTRVSPFFIQGFGLQTPGFRPGHERDHSKVRVFSLAELVVAVYRATARFPIEERLRTAISDMASRCIGAGQLVEGCARRSTKTTCTSYGCLGSASELGETRCLNRGRQPRRPVHPRARSGRAAPRRTERCASRSSAHVPSHDQRASISCTPRCAHRPARRARDRRRPGLHRAAP